MSSPFLAHPTVELLTVTSMDTVGIQLYHIHLRPRVEFYPACTNCLIINGIHFYPCLCTLLGIYTGCLLRHITTPNIDVHVMLKRINKDVQVTARHYGNIQTPVWTLVHRTNHLLFLSSYIPLLSPSSSPLSISLPEVWAVTLTTLWFKTYNRCTPPTH